MKLIWTFTQEEVQAVRDIVEAQSHREMVLDRIQRNVEGAPPLYDEEIIWRTIMLCLLTTQQRSSDGAPVPTFLDLNPFPVDWKTISEISDASAVEAFIKESLVSHGGIRRTNIVPEQAAYNFKRINDVGWDEILQYAKKLEEQRKESADPTHYLLETEAANFIDDTYKGFGPKQSRNFWQVLGLTRYTPVLDSRIQKWIRNNLIIENSAVNDGFWYGSLGSRRYYLFLCELILDLCAQAEVLPCVFDAAVFDSYSK